MSAADLTETEQAHVRTALLYLRLKVGTWAPLAKALHMEPESIGKIVTGKRNVTASLALRVARMVEVTFDDLVAGRYLPARTCPRCGHIMNEYEESEHTAVEREAPREEGSDERLALLKWRLERSQR